MHNTVETAKFGSDFVTLCIFKELIVVLRYKLHMLRVPLDGPADVFCDNSGVVMNAIKPESNPQKKHNATNYHAVYKVAVAGILRLGKEDVETNSADFLTKVLTGQRRWDLCHFLMW